MLTQVQQDRDEVLNWVPLNRLPLTPVQQDQCLIWETKNEVGVGGCDSYLEVLDYYIKLLPKAIRPGCPVPCFLIEIIGVHMAIYGPVYTDTVCVDRLTPCHWLTFQPHNHLAMEKLPKTCKALKVDTHGLLQLYSVHMASTDQSTNAIFVAFLS